MTDSSSRFCRNYIKPSILTAAPIHVNSLHQILSLKKYRYLSSDNVQPTELSWTTPWYNRHMASPIKNNLIIELHVPNLNVVKDFYSKLGFEVKVNDDINETDLGYVTMLRRDKIGNTLINFYGGDDRVYKQSYFKNFPNNTKRGYAIEVTIPVSDIDVLYKVIIENLENHIVRKLVESKDHDYKWKDFRMEDPFGFYIRFTELLDWGQE